MMADEGGFSFFRVGSFSLLGEMNVLLSTSETI